MRATSSIVLGVALWIGVGGVSWLLASTFGSPVDAADAGTDDKVEDAGGEPQAVTLQERLRAPTELAIEDDALFWLGSPYSSKEGSVHRAKKDGTDHITLASGIDRPASLVLGEEYVYFLASTERGTSIERIAKSGADRPDVLVRDSGACGMAAYDRALYFTTSSGTVEKWDGFGRRVVLVRDQTFPCSIAVDESGLYWANRGQGQAGEGTIMKAALDGKSPIPIATEEYGPAALVVADEDAYWATTDGLVRHVKTSGGKVDSVRTTKFSFISAIAVRGARVYWTENGEVWSRGRFEGDASAVVQGLKVARGVGVDEKYVFFTDFGTNTEPDGRVLKIDRPDQ